MNKLKELRKNAHLTLCECEKYTGILRQLISHLEQGDRPLRYWHTQQLITFFNVTYDYLVGNSDKGFKVFLSDMTTQVELKEDEYYRLFNEGKIVESVEYVKGAQTYLPVFKDMKSGQKELTQWRYVRRFKDSNAEKGYTQDLTEELQNLALILNDSQLEQAIKFIKEFIIK